MSHPPLVPQLSYEDIDAAVASLERGFGFALRAEGEFRNPDGTLGHAEMELGGAVIMLGGEGHGTKSPRKLGCGSQHLVIQVADVDAHHARAAAAGVRICCEPEDRFYGRVYEAEDLEGHRWMFIQAQQ